MNALIELMTDPVYSTAAINAMMDSDVSWPRPEPRPDTILRLKRRLDRAKCDPRQRGEGIVGFLIGIVLVLLFVVGIFYLGGNGVEKIQSFIVSLAITTTINNIRSNSSTGYGSGNLVPLLVNSDDVPFGFSANAASTELVSWFGGIILTPTASSNTITIDGTDFPQALCSSISNKPFGQNTLTINSSPYTGNIGGQTAAAACNTGSNNEVVWVFS